MKRYKFKSALLTLLLSFTTLLKGYSAGYEIQVGDREVSIGNTSVTHITLFPIFDTQAAQAYPEDFSIPINFAMMHYETLGDTPSISTILKIRV